ncbi:MAG: hypothetical protein ACLSHG_10710 [Oscillospiraceae bacterium]
MASFALEHLTFTYPGQTRPALSDLRSRSRRAVTVTLRRERQREIHPPAPAQDLPHAARHCPAARVRAWGRALKGIPFAEQARRIGFVLQHPDDQIVTGQGVPRAGVRAREPWVRGKNHAPVRRRDGELLRHCRLVRPRRGRALRRPEADAQPARPSWSLRPDVLILDEPTSQLDPIAASTFLHTLRKLNEELGPTILLSEQRLEEAVPLADHLIVLEQGRLLAAGAPQEVAAAVRGHAIFSAMPTAARIAAALGETGVCRSPCARAERIWGAARTTDASRGARARGHAPVLTVRDGWFRYAQGSADVLRNSRSRCARASSTRSPAATAAAGRRRSACSRTAALYRGSVYLDGRSSARSSLYATASPPCRRIRARSSRLTRSRRSRIARQGRRAGGHGRAADGARAAARPASL